MLLAAGKAQATTSTDALISDLETSLDKLKPIPSLLEKNEWDAVRTILKTPPVNQLWNLGDAKNPLQLIAKATDEFGWIEVKDELSLTLQMCDQLTYDNVFVYFQPGTQAIICCTTLILCMHYLTCVCFRQRKDQCQGSDGPRSESHGATIRNNRYGQEQCCAVP